VNIAVVVFPGSNCEHDVVHALRGVGSNPKLVWHRDDDLSAFDAAVLPGGFAHGDYLRVGAIARFSPVMAEIEAMAAAGKPVLGICNGLQILCEAGLLPGALVGNRDLSFICRFVHVKVESTKSSLTAAATKGRVLRIPLNSYQGSYTAQADVLAEVEANGQVILRYCGPDGTVDDNNNPNGSANGIAGVSNAAGNVVGLMPHPERASEPILGSTDGKVLLESFVSALAEA